MYWVFENIQLLVFQINSALLISHGIRRDTVLAVVLKSEEKTILFNGKYLRNYRPDLQSASGLILKIILSRNEKGAGIKIISLRNLKRKLNEISKIFILEPRAKPLSEHFKNLPAVFIMPSNIKYGCLEKMGIRGNKVSIPNIECFEDHHIITIIHNIADRRLEHG